MNKLWVRMQHQTVGVAPAQLEKERSDIKLLVGTNLSRLSQLEGVDCDLYTTVWMLLDLCHDTLFLTHFIFLYRLFFLVLLIRLSFVRIELLNST